MVFIVSAQLGLGIFGLTRHAVERLGHAGWWLVLALGLVSIGGVGLIARLCGRFQASILAINRKVLGEFLGTSANYLILLELLAASIASLALFIQIMKIFFFRETPFPVLIAFLSTPLIYIAAKGLKTAARFDSFVYIAVLALMGMVLAAWKDAEWTFLLPLTTFKTTAFLPTALRLAFSYIGFELLLVVYPWVRGGKQAPAALAATGLTTLVLTGFVVFATAYFGEEMIIKQVFSLLNMVRSLTAPVIERLDIYFIMIWLPAMGSSTVAFFLTAQLAAVEIFPRASYRLLLAVLAGITILTTLYLRNFDLVLVLTIIIGTIGFFGLGLVWPALILLIAAVRGVRP